MPNERLEASQSADPDVQLDKRLYVEGVGKAMRVLEAFRHRRGPLSLTDIADATGIGRSAAQRFLYTLKVLGYVRQDASTRRYTLSPRVLDFSFAYLRNDALVETAFPYLLEASKRTDETVNLTKLDDTEVIYVSRLPSRNGVSVDIVLGQRLPAFCTAPGRAMLAGLPEERAAVLLARSDRAPRTRFTKTDPSEIDAELTRIRACGYAVCAQEAFVGDLSVAAAVKDHTGNVVAAVNIAVQHPRWSSDAAEATLAPVVLETARAISKALGGR